MIVNYYKPPAIKSESVRNHSKLGLHAFQVLKLLSSTVTISPRDQEPPGLACLHCNARKATVAGHRREYSLVRARIPRRLAKSKGEVNKQGYDRNVGVDNFCMDDTAET